MPYARQTDLPAAVRDVLPPPAQEIHRAAYHRAGDDYDDPEDRRGDARREETAHKVAWAAVKQRYKKRAASRGGTRA